MSILRSKHSGWTWEGRRTPFGGGGGGQPSAPAQQTVTQTNIPSYAEPYVTDMLGRAQALTTQSQYQPYTGQQVAGFTPMQAQAFQNISNQVTPEQIAEASNLASQVGRSALSLVGQGQQLGQAALGFGQTGTEFGRLGAERAEARAKEAQEFARKYGALGAGFGEQAAGLSPQAQAYGRAAADIGRGGLEYGAMGAGLGREAAALSPVAQQFGQESADIGMAGMGYGTLGTGLGMRGALAAEQGFGAGRQFAREATNPYAQAAYMSPYMQNVVDYQKQQAMRDFDITRQVEQARAVAAGAFGGSRQAVAQAEGRRALQNQLAGIQATGTQKAFEDAQRQMQFGAQLGLQGLGAGYQGLQTGMQGAGVGLAGVGTTLQGQQARLAALNQAGQLLGQGMQGAQVGIAGLSPALQGQQIGLSGLGQAGQLYGLGIQGAGMGLQGVGQQIASGQLGLAGTAQGIQGAQTGIQAAQAGIAGGQLGAAGLQASGQAASALGALGQTQFQQEAAINQAMAAAGAQQQALQQRGLDVQYQQYLDSQNYPYRQIGFMSDVLRGLPLAQTSQTMYQAPPSLVSQAAGLGTAGLGLYGLSRMKKGGQVKGSGLADIQLHRLVGKA